MADRTTNISRLGETICVREFPRKRPSPQVSASSPLSPMTVRQAGRVGGAEACVRSALRRGHKLRLPSRLKQVAEAAEPAQRGPGGRRVYHCTLASYEAPRRYHPVPQYIPARRILVPLVTSWFSQARLETKSGAKCDWGMTGALVGWEASASLGPHPLDGRMNELAFLTFHSFSQLLVASAKDGPGLRVDSGAETMSSRRSPRARDRRSNKQRTKREL